MIKYEGNKAKYFDKNGTEITEGCKIQYENGQVKTVYLTENDELGIDATNPKWIKSGRAVPCEYGIYPLNVDDTDSVIVVNK